MLKLLLFDFLHFKARLHFKTRGHNTNNYSEASTRIPKEIVPSPAKAFNAVALVKFLAVTWEKYVRN